MLTAGELIAYLQGYDPDTPVVVDGYTDDGRYIRVDDINVTSAQGRGPDGIELEIFWEVEGSSPAVGSPC